MAKEWLDKCERRFKFLSPEPTVVIAPDPKQEARIKALEDELKSHEGNVKKLTEILKDYSKARELEKKSALELEDKSKHEVGTGA